MKLSTSFVLAIASLAGMASAAPAPAAAAGPTLASVEGNCLMETTALAETTSSTFAAVYFSTFYLWTRDNGGTLNPNRKANLAANCKVTFNVPAQKGKKLVTNSYRERGTLKLAAGNQFKHEATIAVGSQSSVFAGTETGVVAPWSSYQGGGAIPASKSVSGPCGQNAQLSITTRMEIVPVKETDASEFHYNAPYTQSGGALGVGWSWVSC